MIPFFMVGDSFAPSGLDDYCLMNRNLMRDGTGYLLCMEKIRKAQKNLWLINEHIPYLFRFNPDELDYMETRYRERMRLLSELFPDDLNYGIDEQWAVFYPYGLKAAAQSVAEVSVKITNHSRVNAPSMSNREPGRDSKSMHPPRTGTHYRSPSQLSRQGRSRFLYNYRPIQVSISSRRTFTPRAWTFSTGLKPW